MQDVIDLTVTPLSRACGAEIRVAHPKGYELAPEVRAEAEVRASPRGAHRARHERRTPHRHGQQRSRHHQQTGREPERCPAPAQAAATQPRRHHEPTAGC